MAGWRRGSPVPTAFESSTRTGVRSATASATSAPEANRPGHGVRPRLRTVRTVVDTRPDLDEEGLFWQSYSWIAMLDPVELSHHVAVDRVREDVVAGRPAWRADLRALLGYEPCCGGNCCELLYSEAGLMADFHDPAEVPESWRGRAYPDHYDVALDLQTGVVVRCLPVDGEPGAPRLENDILGADAGVNVRLS